MDVIYEAVTHPFDVVHRHIEVHLLFCVLEEIIFRESIVDNLLIHYRLLKFILLWYNRATEDVVLFHGSGRSVVFIVL